MRQKAAESVARWEENDAKKCEKWATEEAKRREKRRINWRRSTPNQRQTRI